MQHVEHRALDVASMRLDSFTFVDKEPRFDFWRWPSFPGNTNAPDRHVLDSVPSGGLFQVEVDADTALPAYIYMRPGCCGINEACAGLGLIQLRSYWVDPNAPLCSHAPS